MAKLLTQRAAFEVADDGLQIHGGAGYMEDRARACATRAWARSAAAPTRS